MQTTHFILLIPEIHGSLHPKLTEGAEQASQTDRQLQADA